MSHFAVVLATVTLFRCPFSNSSPLEDIVKRMTCAVVCLQSPATSAPLEYAANVLSYTPLSGTTNALQPCSDVSALQIESSIVVARLDYRQLPTNIAHECVTQKARPLLYKYVVYYPEYDPTDNT